MKDLSDTALRVILIITTCTVGWIEDKATGRRKEKDWISYSQLCKTSGRGTQAVSSALRELEEKELIEILDQNGRMLRTREERRGKKLFYRLKTSLKIKEVPNEPNLFDNQSLKIKDTKETNTKLDSNKLESKQRNADVDRILLEFHLLTGLSKPSDVRPRQWAYLFAQHHGVSHFTPTLKHLRALWPNVTINKLETVYRNFPTYERDVLAKKDTGVRPVRVIWDDEGGGVLVEEEA